MGGGLDENRVHQVVQLVSRTRNRNRFHVLAKFWRLLRLDLMRRRQGGECYGTVGRFPVRHTD